MPAIAELANNNDSTDGYKTMDDEDIVYQITTYGADFTVDGLVKRFERGDIFIPDFQRSYVWTLRQASKFIESILLGLPIPSVFLYREEKTHKLLIIDGLQRLSTLYAFYKGKFPRSNQTFRLKDVKSKYKNRSLTELAEEDHRRLEDSVIHAMIIQQTVPGNDNSSVYHIFDRLNSNGTPLHPQEMRAAIYHGPFQELLAKLNQESHWREIYGPIHKRAKDQELVLRFLALANTRNAYIKPMKIFLNKFMNENRSLNKQSEKKLTAQFVDTINRAHEALGHRAFRPQRTINIAVFDAMMIGIFESVSATPNRIKTAYQNLIHREEFMNLCSKATSDEPNVANRINMAIEEINAPK